jgi:hypothetical protein
VDAQQELERFGAREVVLQRVLVAEVDDAARTFVVRGDRRAVEQHLAGLGRRDAGDEAQQAGLAAPVAAAQPDQSRRPQREVDLLEQQPRAAPAREAARREMRLADVKVESMTAGRDSTVRIGDVVTSGCKTRAARPTVRRRRRCSSGAPGFRATDAFATS